MVVFAVAHRAQPVDGLAAIFGRAPASLFQRGNERFAPHLVRVAGDEFADAKLVGGHPEMPVRNALGDPQPARAFGRRCHFHHPGFLRVGHRQGLARAVIAVGFNQLAHKLDGFARRARAFQRHAGKLGRIEQALARLGAIADEGAVRAFAEHQPVLVHDAVGAIQIGIGMRHLRNVADGNAGFFVGMGIAGRALRVDHARQLESIELRQIANGRSGSMYRTLTAFRPVARGHIDDGLVVQVVVIGMADHHAAIGAGAGGDDGSGAGARLRCGGQQGKRQHKRAQQSAAAQEKGRRQCVHGVSPDSQIRAPQTPGAHGAV